jgi:hypothetical protein
MMAESCQAGRRITAVLTLPFLALALACSCERLVLPLGAFAPWEGFALIIKIHPLIFADDAAIRLVPVAWLQMFGAKLGVGVEIFRC